MNKTTHQVLLERLLGFEAPVEGLTEALHDYGWDSERPLITLTRQHIIDILVRYLQNALTENQVEEWANAIENREDIEYEKGREDIIQSAIFELANPLLAKPLNPECAEQLIDEISR